MNRPIYLENRKRTNTTLRNKILSKFQRYRLSRTHTSKTSGGAARSVLNSVFSCLLICCSYVSLTACWCRTVEPKQDGCQPCRSTLQSMLGNLLPRCTVTETQATHAAYKHSHNSKGLLPHHSFFFL